MWRGWCVTTPLCESIFWLRRQAIYTDLLNHISGMQSISNSFAWSWSRKTNHVDICPALPLSTCLPKTKEDSTWWPSNQLAQKWIQLFYHLVTRSKMCTDHLLSPCASGSTVFCRCLCQSNFFPNEGTPQNWSSFTVSDGNCSWINYPCPPKFFIQNMFPVTGFISG